jgi:hypothetical protein
MENGDIKFPKNKEEKEKSIKAMDQLIEDTTHKRTATILRIKDRIKSEEKHLK